MKHKEALLKSAEIAKINLTGKEAAALVKEIDDILAVFSKIDIYTDETAEIRTIKKRALRKDQVQKSTIDPFSNTKYITERKFKGPKLVE